MSSVCEFIPAPNFNGVNQLSVYLNLNDTLDLKLCSNKINTVITPPSKFWRRKKQRIQKGTLCFLDRQNFIKESVISYCLIKQSELDKSFIACKYKFVKCSMD